MIIEKLICGDLGQNTYFVCDAKSAVLIDASASVEDVERLLDIYGVRLKGILITHAHFDHILNLDQLMERFKCPVYIDSHGVDILQDADKNISYIVDDEFIVTNLDYISVVMPNSKISGIFDFDIETRYTPGHSLDSLCFKLQDVMFTGDTLFCNTVGRTDMYGGSVVEEKNSMVKLRDFIVGVNRLCSGHGDDFTYEEALETIEYYSR